MVSSISCSNNGFGSLAFINKGFISYDSILSSFDNNTEISNSESSSLTNDNIAYSKEKYDLLLEKLCSFGRMNTHDQLSYDEFQTVVKALTYGTSPANSQFAGGTDFRTINGNFINSLDWETEYQKYSEQYTTKWNEYLETRGCKNKEELELLDKTIYYTTDQLKNTVAGNISSVITAGMMRNPELKDAPKVIDEIVASLDLSDLADYVSYTGEQYNSDIESIQALLRKVDNDKFMSLVDEKTYGDTYLNQLISILDRLPEQLEAEQAMYEENGYVDFSAYYQQYNQNMIAKYGQTGMIGQNFRDIYV